MTLQELKQAIIDEDISDELIIFKCSDNNFIANQYIEAISDIKNLAINKIDTLAETTEMSALSLVFDYSERLNVLRTDCFAEDIADFSAITNTIIVCNSIDKKLDKKLTDYIIAVPKLTDWQIAAYVGNLCPELSADEISWLVSAAGNNIYKTLNELDKVLLFDKEDRHKVFEQIKQADLFMCNIPYYAVPSAIVDLDMETIINYLVHKDYCECAPFSLISQALNKYKQGLLLTRAKGVTAADFGLKSDYYIKKSMSRFSETDLKNKIKFLSEINLRLTNGQLDLTDEQKVDYIICKLLA